MGMRRRLPRVSESPGPQELSVDTSVPESNSVPRQAWSSRWTSKSEGNTYSKRGIITPNTIEPNKFSAKIMRNGLNGRSVERFNTLLENKKRASEDKWRLQCNLRCLLRFGFHSSVALLD